MKCSTVLNCVEELLSETNLVVSTSEKIYAKKKIRFQAAWIPKQLKGVNGRKETNVHYYPGGATFFLNAASYLSVITVIQDVIWLIWEHFQS